MRISHLLYADDLLIFANGGKDSIRNLREVIQKYEDISGQLVNPQKSSIFFSYNIPCDRKVELKCISGFIEGAWPCTYLGILLHVGHITLRLFEPLLARVQKKVGRMEE